ITIPSGDFLSTPFEDGPLLPPQAATATVTMAARMPQAKHRRTMGETYPVSTPGPDRQDNTDEHSPARTRVGTREDGLGLHPRRPGSPTHSPDTGPARPAQITEANVPRSPASSLSTRRV